MSPLRSRKVVNVGPWLRANVTHRSLLTWLRDVLDGDGRITTRPWTSLSLGPRGLSFNTRRRTGRVDLPGPFSYETDPVEFGDRVDRLRARMDQDPAFTPHPLPYVSDEDAEQETCTRCGAEPGQHCRTMTHGDPTDPHAPRIKAARERAADDPPPWGTPPTGDDRP